MYLVPARSQHQKSLLNNLETVFQFWSFAFALFLHCTKHAMAFEKLVVKLKKFYMMFSMTKAHYQIYLV